MDSLTSHPWAFCSPWPDSSSCTRVQWESTLPLMACRGQALVRQWPAISAVFLQGSSSPAFKCYMGRCSCSGGLV